jgi:hypothetical protein
MKVAGKNNPHFKSNTKFSSVFQFCLLITLDLQHSNDKRSCNSSNWQIQKFHLAKVQSYDHPHIYASMREAHAPHICNTKTRLHDSYLECLYFCRVVQTKALCGAASKYGWLLVIMSVCFTHQQSTTSSMTEC